MPEFKTDDGVRLRYRVQGNGALPVIYLHGMGGDVSSWEGLWSSLNPGGYRHVALDFRGHGASQRMPSSFTHERLARDVLHLADELGLKRFTIVGHSFGGKISLKVAALAPDRVIGLVLIGTVGPGFVPLEREAVDSILNRSGDLEFVRQSFRSWFTVWPRPELDRWAINFAHTPAWAHRSACEIALWTNISSEVAGITVPTLVIAGKHDPVYGPAYQKEAVLLALPQAEFQIVNCGHGLILECPGEIAVHCTRFMESGGRS